MEVTLEGEQACMGRWTTVVRICPGVDHQLGQGENFVALVP